MSVPARTDEQRAQALAAALAVRIERARLRTELKARRISGAEVIGSSGANRLWAGLKVSWLLEALPGVGKVRAGRIMADLDIAPSRRIQGLGSRQRSALLSELEREGR